MTKKTRSYSDEFKAEAIKKILDNNGNISASAKQLGIATHDGGQLFAFFTHDFVTLASDRNTVMSGVR